MIDDSILQQDGRNLPNGGQQMKASLRMLAVIVLTVYTHAVGGRQGLTALCSGVNCCDLLIVDTCIRVTLSGAKSGCG